MKIHFPLSRFQVYNLIVVPHMHGCDLIHLAFQGKDRSLIPQKLSLSHRIVCFLQGAALLVPLLSTVVWIFWKTFGNQDKLLTHPFTRQEPPSVLY